MHIWKVIAVIGVEQRPVGHRPRQIRRPAAARGVGHGDRLDAPVVVEAHVVVDHEVVALAGDDHVVVAIGPGLRRPAALRGHQRGGGGEQVSLGLLAAEGAAHAAHLDGHGVRRHAQHLRDHALNLAGMLSRGDHRHIVVLAGNRHGNLSLEVEVVLPADGHAIRHAARRPLEGSRRVAARQGQRFGDERPRRPRRLDCKDRRQRRVCDHRQPRGAARLIARARGHGEDRLSGVFDQIGREHGLVVAVGRADVVGARYVDRRDHQQYALGRPHRPQVETLDPRMGLGGDAQIDVKQVRGFGQVVDVGGLAGHVLVAAVVAARLVDGARDGVRHGQGSGHRPGGSRPRGRWSRYTPASAGFGLPGVDSPRSPASR